MTNESIRCKMNDIRSLQEDDIENSKFQDQFMNLTMNFRTLSHFPRVEWINAAFERFKIKSKE